MSNIRDPRWQKASRSLQPRPRVRTGSLTTLSAAAAELSEFRSYSSMTGVREKALHNYLKFKDVLRRSETTSAYVLLEQDLMAQRNEPPVYAHSGKPSHSNFRYDYPATPNSLRHLPANVYNRNTAQPIFDGHVGKKDARSADDGWPPPRPELSPRPSIGLIRGVSGKTEASSAFTPRARARLKRNYTAFDTDHRPQQGQAIQPNVEPSPASYFMSPGMQYALLPSSSVPESITEQEAVVNRLTRELSALRAHSASVPESITEQQRASPVPAMYVGNATPPSPPPQAVYQCDFPDCHKSFVRKDLHERHKERHNGPEPQPPASPEGSNSNKKQTATGHTPSYTFQIDEIDELDDCSAKIASDVISSSAYRFPREKLKYTISEDRTMNSFKRHRACFLALEQPARRTTKFEPSAMRPLIFINREDRVETIEQPSNLVRLLRGTDVQGLNTQQDKDVEVSAQSSAWTHSTKVYPGPLPSPSLRPSDIRVLADPRNIPSPPHNYTNVHKASTVTIPQDRISSYRPPNHTPDNHNTSRSRADLERASPATHMLLKTPRDHPASMHTTRSYKHIFLPYSSASGGEM